MKGIVLSAFILEAEGHGKYDSSSGSNELYTWSNLESFQHIH